MYNDDGILNFAYALLAQAKEEAFSKILYGDYIGARASAGWSSKGIVGNILEYATGDRDFLIKVVDEEIKKQKFSS